MTSLKTATARKTKAVLQRCTRDGAVAVTVVAAAALAACGAAEPAPNESFYRLSSVRNVSEVARVAQPLDGAIRVRRFTAESLLGQRPIVYVAQDSPRQLTQYHYEFWSDEPTRMLQSLTVDALRRAGAAPLVFSSELDASSDYEVDGAIKQLEHVAGAQPEVRLGIEFALSCDRGAELLLLRAFDESETAQDRTVDAAVQAFDRALARIFDALVREIVQARACRRA